ncbi:hypothetical protein C8Q77DRAFT_1142778 [Trametes polyzona]|nr:hypothetical protein C8Q77DRAFT_1142778 [Trametes polyzona]
MISTNTVLASLSRLQLSDDDNHRGGGTEVYLDLGTSSTDPADFAPLPPFSRSFWDDLEFEPAQDTQQIATPSPVRHVPRAVKLDRVEVPRKPETPPPPFDMLRILGSVPLPQDVFVSSIPPTGWVATAPVLDPILFGTDALGYPVTEGTAGFPLGEACASRFDSLLDRDEQMLTLGARRGPSVRIGISWPGYAQWSRQIPTRDFRSPPQPITRAKLARSIATMIRRFISEMSYRPVEDERHARWRVGGRDGIMLEDLVLVSLVNIRGGLWQPQFRVLPRRSQRRALLPSRSLL